MRIITLTIALGLLQSLASAEVYQKLAAKVGTEIITEYDVETAAKMVETGMSQAEYNSEEGKKKLAEDRKKVLDRMIEEKLVVMAAEKGPEGYKEAVDKGTAPANPYTPTGLEVEEELDKAFDESRNKFQSQAEFEAYLKSVRMSLAEFRSRLRDRLRVQMTFSRMVKAKEKEFQPSLRISDEEAKAFYEENRSRFAIGEQVSLRHILYNPGEGTKAAAAVKALSAAKNLKAEFIALAKKESRDDLTASKGGLLGWVEKGGLRWTEVEAKAFTAPLNVVQGPIKSSEGLHVFVVEDKKAGEQKTFEEVKAQVRNVLYQQKIQKRIEDWVEDLKREFYVERNDS